MALHVPLKWLRDYVDVDLSPAELAERLTLAGMEVESVTNPGAAWDRDKLVVGRLEAVDPHPDADRLCLATVTYGQGRRLTVVTGAPNLVQYAAGGLPDRPFKVALALVGAELIDGHAADGRRVRLKPGKIRGVRSEGMVCSELELGLSEEHEGILLLPEDAPEGAPLADVLGDEVLEFDIKGGFAHLMSVFGIARETAALTGRPLRRDVLAVGRQGDPQITPTPDFVRLEIADPELCGRYVGLLIEDVRVQPSPFWLQQRLRHAGMRPINAVVDVTNYVMLELGQPLHAFDHARLRGEGEGPLIRVRRALPGERMETLDGVERTFDEQMLLITDGGGPVAVAGVMGGADSEISADTTTVLLESANFEFLNNRRTAQVLKLRTESSDRFGRGLDPELCLPAALRAAFLIAELCGGRVRPQYGDLYPRPPVRPTIPLEAATIERLLGVPIPRAEVVRILEALEFEVAGEDPLQVTPPSHRRDVTIPADLVEEVGRVYGYDRMAPTLIRDELPPQRRNRALDGAERVRDLLAGCGLNEIITYSIVSRAEEARLLPAEAAPEEASVPVRNPLAADRAHLRRTLLTEGLNTVRNNLRFLPRVAVFEVGEVFLPRPDKVLPAEPRRVCAVLAGPREPDSWQVPREREGFDFFDVKGVAEALLDGLELNGVAWKRSEHPAFHPGRAARLEVDGRSLGDLGELHPRVAARFGLEGRTVCALELDLDDLLARWQEDRQMVPLSAHPPVYEDLAFIVDEALPSERVQALIGETGRPLVTAVALFDLFRDPRLGEGKKSLAYALTYQAPDRTLTDKEVARVRTRIVKRLESELGARLRA